MPFDVHKPKAPTSSFSILRTATAEELAEYEEYKLQSKKENFQEEKIDLIKSGTTRTDVTANISNRDTKIVPIKPAVQNQVTTRTDIPANIFNRDSKIVSIKPAVQNQVSKRNFLK
jgi:hypothetical protein